MLSIDGLATGIDTATIIEGLLSIQQSQIDRLTGRQDKIVEEQTAFKSIEARLISLQSQLRLLARAQNSVFENKTVASRDEGLIVAAAGPSAVPGVYNFRVNSLARAHQVATQAFADSSSLITQGTLDISVGDGAATTVTIDGTNNTLQGLADAINDSGADVTATVIDDGGTGDSYRILLSSNKTGTAGAVSIVNNLAASSGEAIKPLFAGSEITPSSIAAPVTGAGFGAAATPLVNAGAGNYTGPDNDTYTFTFLENGRFGDHNIEIAYSDGSGDNTGVVDYRTTDADTFVTIAEGVQIKFEAGGIAVQGSAYTVDVSNDTATVSPAITDPGYAAAAETTPLSDEGLGSYSGPDDDTYTLTFLESGVIGRDHIDIAYADGSGENTGTITLDPAEVDTFQTIAEGLQIKFDAGLLVQGDTFTVDVTAESTSSGAEVQAAADASISFGSGPGALTVTSSTNQIENVIPGVTLDVLAADSNRDVTITVGNDVEAAKTAITDFVDSYNDLMEFIDEQVRFEQEAEVAGVLLGNRSAISIQDDVRNSVLEVVAGVSTDMNRLSALGISVTSNGRLSVDSARLDRALNGGIEGVTIDDIRRLFALDGQSDNGNVRFVVAGDKTKETATGYEVDIIQAAERATITATNALAASTVIDSSNNTLIITVDGRQSSSLELAEGTYTREELAAHLESVIAADAELPGRDVTVQVVGDHLKLTSETYGINSGLSIGSGTAVQWLLA